MPHPEDLRQVRLEDRAEAAEVGSERLQQARRVALGLAQAGTHSRTRAATSSCSIVRLSQVPRLITNRTQEARDEVRGELAVRSRVRRRAAWEVWREPSALAVCLLVHTTTDQHGLDRTRITGVVLGSVQMDAELR